MLLLMPLLAVLFGHAQAGGCTFMLGFAALHDLLPSVIGDCVSNEMHDPNTGDAVQQTTNGLLVWRKSDNWTAFTDGFESWVNGPLGLEQRQNDQRLWWEPNPQDLPIVPAPVAGERCHTAGLSLVQGRVDAGAGNFVGTFRFVNNLDVACTFFGFPGAQLLDGSGDALPTSVVRNGGYFSNSPRPSTVDVSPHGAGLFRIHWEQVPVGDETTCPEASAIAITPPDEYVPLQVDSQIRACGQGHLDITALLPDAASSSRPGRLSSVLPRAAS
jgi:hypothetical protein